MLKIGIILLATLCTPAWAEFGQHPESEGIVRETEAHSVFRGALYKVWLKLRAVSPTEQTGQAGRGQLVVTAGIRGAETTESALTPYWKDDRATDANYIAQIQAFNAVQAMLDAGELQTAKTALQQFIQPRTHPVSIRATGC